MLTAVFEYLVVAVWPVMLVGSLGRLVLDLLRRRIGASLALTKCCAPRLLGLPFEYREGRSYSIKPGQLPLINEIYMCIFLFVEIVVYVQAK